MKKPATVNRSTILKKVFVRRNELVRYIKSGKTCGQYRALMSLVVRFEKFDYYEQLDAVVRPLDLKELANLKQAIADLPRLSYSNKWARQAAICAKRCADSSLNWDEVEMTSMNLYDALEYIKMAKYLEEGRVKKAYGVWRNMDTCPREEVDNQLYDFMIESEK